MVLEKARKILTFFQNRPQKCFEAGIFKNTSITNAWQDNGRVNIEFKLPVLEEFTNAYGPLHGGAITTMIDELTAMAVWTQDRQAREMVSTDISVAFASAAFVGEELKIIAKCDKVGKNLGFASAEIYSGSKLVASGKHTLFMLSKPLEYE